MMAAEPDLLPRRHAVCTEDESEVGEDEPRPGARETSLRRGDSEGEMMGRGIFGIFGNLNFMLFFGKTSKQIHHR